MLIFSRNLAVFLGIVTPLLETWRRWSTWQSDPPAFFDDYVLGALLLFGAWQVTKNARNGQKFLTLAWGFCLAMVYDSFFGQFAVIGSEPIDPSEYSAQVAVMVKGIGFILIIIGLITSLPALPVDNSHE